MNHFTQTPKAEIQRSSFDRSHGHKTTIDGGYLYPVYLDEALPGDTFNLKMHAVARMTTPIFPLMDNIYLDTQFFAVPYRLLWDNWERFNGAQTDPDDTTDYLMPVVSGVTNTRGNLADYFGLPYATGSVNVQALPFRAYNLIWNEWYRDQNLQDSANVPKGDGPDLNTDFYLRRRGKRHDYFTSCLPWPQKGPGAMVPVVGSNSLAGSASTPLFTSPGASPNNPFTLGVSLGTRDVLKSAPSAAADDTIRWDNSALAATVESIRQAFQVQRIYERDARGGTRYTELIKAHFGVTSPDARLQRPEYLGGFSQPVNISQIHQTSGTAGTGGYTDTPLGQVGAIGTAHLDGNRNGFTSSFTEHCLIIGLVSVRADMTYQQKLDRMWSRRTRFDHYWPALAHIGEQAVLSKELYFAGDAADEDVFGYQERFAEYRYKPSIVTGLFRSDVTTPLDAWHLAYDFAARPVLNEAFILEDPPLDRVVAVPAEPKFILDMWFELNCARPMPMYGVPGMVDHF